VFVLGFVAALKLTHGAEDGAVPLLVSGLFAFVVAPFSLLSTLSWAGRARAFKRDLEGGRVLRFAGTLSSFDSLALDPDLALLTRRGLLQPEPGVEQELVVLPVSRELLYANRAWAPDGIALHTERVALPPECPLKVPLPDDVEAHAADVVSVARRRLTSEELEELARHARSLRRPGRMFWVVCAFLGMALYSWYLDAWAMPPRPLTVPVLFLAGSFALMMLWRRAKLAARLQQDLELGWVLTVDHAPQAADSDTDLPAQGVETLLHARLDWTVNRRPAAWRRFGGRRAP
jgi:hypothetical protein